LGTHLVELGFIGTDQLSQALSRQMGVPAALEHHFSHADPAVVGLLKGNLAARYLAVPVAGAPSGIRQVVTVLATPLDVPTIDDLSFALGARVEPLVAGEIVIARNIKRLYGLDVKLKAGKPASMPAHAIPPAVVEWAIAPRTPTPRPPAAPSVSPKDATVPRSPAPEQALAVAEAPRLSTAPQVIQPPGPTQPRERVPAPSLEEAIRLLTAATQREQLADIVVAFMRGTFGCGMFLTLRDGQARVWRGFAPGVPEAAIETIAFPISMPSCFELAYDHCSPFRGRPPAEGKRLQRQIWKYLHCDQPSEVFVVPIQVKGRVLNLVYVHASDGGPLPDGPVTDLQAVCAAASSTYVRMIQRQKANDLAASTPDR